MERQAYLDELVRLQATRNVRSSQEISTSLAFVLEHGEHTDAVLRTKPREGVLTEDEAQAVRSLTSHLQDSWTAFLGACREALAAANPNHPLSPIALGAKLPTRPESWLRRRLVVEKLRNGKRFQVGFLAQRAPDAPSYGLTAAVWTDPRLSGLTADAARALSLDRVVTGVDEDRVGFGTFALPAKEGARMSAVARALVKGIWPLAAEVYRRTI